MKALQFRFFLSFHSLRALKSLSWFSKLLLPTNTQCTAQQPHQTQPTFSCCLCKPSATQKHSQHHQQQQHLPRLVTGEPNCSSIHPPVLCSPSLPGKHCSLTCISWPQTITLRKPLKQLLQGQNYTVSNITISLFWRVLAICHFICHLELIPVPFSFMFLQYNWLHFTVP